VEPAGPPMAGPVDGGVVDRPVDRLGSFGRGRKGDGIGFFIILPDDGQGADGHSPNEVV